MEYLICSIEPNLNCHIRENIYVYKTTEIYELGNEQIIIFFFIKIQEYINTITIGKSTCFYFTYMSMCEQGRQIQP